MLLLSLSRSRCHRLCLLCNLHLLCCNLHLLFRSSLVIPRRSVFSSDIILFFPPEAGKFINSSFGFKLLSVFFRSSTLCIRFYYAYCYVIVRFTLFCIQFNKDSEERFQTEWTEGSYKTFNLGTYRVRHNGSNKEVQREQHDVLIITISSRIHPDDLFTVYNLHIFSLLVGVE